MRKNNLSIFYVIVDGLQFFDRVDQKAQKNTGQYRRNQV
jgi:hypothetical protein